MEGGSPIVKWIHAVTADLTDGMKNMQLEYYYIGIGSTMVVGVWTTGVPLDESSNEILNRMRAFRFIIDTDGNIYQSDFYIHYTKPISVAG